jgi:hypothetical protein
VFVSVEKLKQSTLNFGEKTEREEKGAGWAGVCTDMLGLLDAYNPTITPSARVFGRVVALRVFFNLTNPSGAKRKSKMEGYEIMASALNCSLSTAQRAVKAPRALQRSIVQLSTKRW